MLLAPRLGHCTTMHKTPAGVDYWTESRQQIREAARKPPRSPPAGKVCQAAPARHQSWLGPRRRLGRGLDAFVAPRVELQQIAPLLEPRRFKDASNRVSVWRHQIILAPIPAHVFKISPF